MRGFSLRDGAWSAAIGLLGAGALSLFPNQLWLGWGLIILGALLLAWAVRVKGRHLLFGGQRQSSPGSLLIECSSFGSETALPPSLRFMSLRMRDTNKTDRLIELIPHSTASTLNIQGGGYRVTVTNYVDT